MPKPPANGKVPPNDGKSDSGRTDGLPHTSSAERGPDLEPERMDETVTPLQQVENLAEKITEVTREFGNQAVKIVQDTKGCPDIIKRDIGRDLGTLKKDKLAELAIVLDHLRTVIPGGKPEESGKTFGRATRAVDIRDLMENCETDIMDSLDVLANWLVRDVPILDPIIQNQIKFLDEKLKTFKHRDHAALVDLETAIMDRFSQSSDRPVVEFNRPSMEWDDQELPAEVVKEQGEVRAKVADLETKLAEAESIVSSYNDRIRSLDLASRALVCEEPEARTQIGVMAKKIEDLKTQLDKANDPLFQTHDPCIADLENKLATAHSQLTATRAELGDVHKTNKDLQDLVDAYTAKDGGAPGGLFGGTSFPGITGTFKATTPPSTSTFGHSALFGTAKVNFSVPPPTASTFGSPTPHPAGTDTDRLANALEMLARNQAMPQLPAPEPFSGNAKNDKQSLGDFLEKYERRVANCTESDKVSLLSEYLVGEAKRAYRSVVSTHERLTFDQLCRKLKGMMVDSSRTGRLLKKKRFDDLKIRNGQTYLSFICLIESQVMDAYGEADDQTVDQMKTKVLLNNVRERDLMMHVENALRTARDDEDQFPVVKQLAVSYERTEASANKWHSYGNGHYGGAPCYNYPKSHERPTSGANFGNVPAAGSSTPSSSPFACFYCKEAGHRASECPKKSQPKSSGGNSAKLGNFKAPKCYACGQLGHMSPACPNKYGENPGTSNLASAKKRISRGTPRPARPVRANKVVSSLEGFANMCSSQTEAEILKNVVGAPCVAPVIVNGFKAKALFDSGSEVNIIGRAFLRDVLRKCDRKLLNFPGIHGHPSGLNIRDASGKAMPFAGVVCCELQVDKSDKPELHKFLVQEDPNFEVVIGTPTLSCSPKWRDRLSKILKTCNGRDTPNAGVNPSVNIYSKRVTVKRAESSENRTTVRYLGPQKLEKRVQMDFLRKCRNRRDVDGLQRRMRMSSADNLAPSCQAAAASIWTAKNAFEQARGGAVAESIKVDTITKDHFFLGASQAVIEYRQAEPTEDQLVQTMLKLADQCEQSKAALQISVAERVRAVLDGNKILRADETIVIGGSNVKRFAVQLGIKSTPAGTMEEMRSFLTNSHFSSIVKRVFIWPEVIPDEFQQIVMSSFIESLKEAVAAAAVWKHVFFVVMPMAYADGHRPLFDSFMEAFTSNSLHLANVLWLDDSIELNGLRFARSLGANQLFKDDQAVRDTGEVNKKGAAAAVKFLKELCSWLIIEPKPSTSHSDMAYQSPLQDAVVAKMKPSTSARGVPHRGGGGGGRGYFQRGRGNHGNSPYFNKFQFQKRGRGGRGGF